ncbi:phosphatase PAP2 family protein [Aurantiacibacter gilvus]|uniref:Phosphatase PAP2 family protein n=1 Tax=Aurantiacibacter gilvus TaxID=3139141 RepID=A0ABU9IFT9_9SPHN
MELLVGSSCHRRYIVAYGLIILLALLPELALTMISDDYDLPPVGQGRFPFVVFSIAIAGMIALLRPLYLVVRLHPSPAKQLLADVRTHLPTLIAMTIMILALPETLDAATRFKKIIPQIQPFYLDPAVAELERSLLGMDAWRYTHAFIGPVGTRIIDTVYGYWHLVNIGLLCWICLTPDRRFQILAGLSYQLAWLVLGAGMATALSSVGPCFYETFFGADDFAPLMERLHAIGDTDGLHSLTAMDYLLASAGTDAIGGGISALPSLHVAIATLAVLVAREKFRGSAWPTALAAVYAGTIFVGSVHLGWHYAIDGLLGAAGMLAIWFPLKLALNRLLPDVTGSHEGRAPRT